MSFGFNRFTQILRHKKVVGASLLSAAATVVGLKQGTNAKGWLKDEIFYLSEEENQVPSRAKIFQKEVEENRGPILSNGDLNWGCRCIEREVIGPCNLEFRPLRQMIHDCDYSREKMTDQEKERFDEVLENYILCTMEHPLYYRESLTEEEKKDLEEEERKENERKENEKRRKEANKRIKGKDTIVFLTRAENKIPSQAKIEQKQVTEYRSPVYPNGDLNWACTCIERDVIGPCNIEFRAFRQYIHDRKDGEDPDEMPEEEDLLKLHGLIRNFLACTKKHPVYYGDLIKSVTKSDETDSDFDKKTDDDETVVKGSL